MQRRLTSINGAPRKVDGGVLFGSTPKRSWAQWMQPDPDNLVELPSRALLVQEPGRNVLIMAGSELLLASQERACSCKPALPSVLGSLARAGLSEGDIDLVILSHLQACPTPSQQQVIDEGGVLRVLFPNARFLTGMDHWRRALHPHPHDRGRFITWMLRQLEHGGRLLLADEGSTPELGRGWRLHLSDGHTRGQLLPEVMLPNGPVLFAGDLIPARPWLDLAVTSAYDRNPELLVGEKERMLDYLVDHRGRLFMPRDPQHAVIKVVRDRQARYVAYDHVTALQREEA